MIITEELDLEENDPVAKFWDTLNRTFKGNHLCASKPMQKLLTMLSNEKDTDDGGSAALKLFKYELYREGFEPTLDSLSAYLFSSEKNPALLDLCNLPNGGEASDPRSSCTLKVKVYMGEGWKVDFRYLDGYSPPDLYVEVGIASGDEPMKRTKVKKNSWKPTWGEELSFNLADPEAALLSIKVYDHDVLTRDDFAGETTLRVSLLSPGIRFVPLWFSNSRRSL